MANFTFGATTICPFYLRETEKSITCEGLQGNATIVLKFLSSSQKQKFQKQKCGNFNYIFLCSIAAAIMREKYTE